MNKQRLIWVDCLKGILIVLVVLGHAVQHSIGKDNHLWNIIYSFHMPAFMAVSGYLCYRGNEIGGGISKRLSIIYKRFKQLVTPFFIWSAIQVIIYEHCSMKAFADIFLYPDRYFWFLLVLFFINVFFQLGDYLSEKLRIKQEIIDFGLCLMFVVLMMTADIRILGFQFIAYYFVFYVVGYYLHKYNRVVTDKTWVLCGLTVIWAVMAWFWKMHELPSFLKGVPLPQQALQYGYRFLTAMIAVYVLLGIGPKLFICESWWNKPFLQLGIISLGVYTIHILLIPPIFLFVEYIFTTQALIISTSCIMLLAISWFLVWLIGKNSITSRFLLGK